MRYVSPNYEVVVNAQGGYSALERLGFKPESTNREDEMAKKKKTVVNATAKLETKPAANVEAVETQGRSRNQLMEVVKSRGIKNFRVMNKAELREIFNGASQTRISEIQVEAVTRWKSGWGKKKEQ